MKATILLFNIPDKSIRNQLRNLFTSLKINVKYIEKSGYSKTLGQLAGISPVKLPLAPYTGPELPAPMIIFVNIPDQMLDLTLAKLRDFSAASFPYKAVLTQTNANWTVTDCFAEIKREHEIMHANDKN